MWCKNEHVLVLPALRTGLFVNQVVDAEARCRVRMFRGFVPSQPEAAVCTNITVLLLLESSGRWSLGGGLGTLRWHPFATGVAEPPRFQ